MSRKRRNGRLYLKGGRYYADFRDLGGKLEALKPTGERLATTDSDIATALVSERVKELESIRRGIAILGRGREQALGSYAQHHLERKKMLNEATDWTLGGVQRQLERAVEFFGTSRPLTAIDVSSVQEWAVWLRERHRGHRGNATLSDGAVRHHLNSLSNMFRRAGAEGKVPPGYNPVAAWDRKPKGRPEEARWLEPHEAALLLEACKTYKPEHSDVALGDLSAVVGTFLLTGGRFAEVMGLARDDVNFSRKTVTFREHAWRRLKTATSQRVVPLWPQLDELLRHYLDGPPAPTGALLFQSEHRRVRGHDEVRMLTDIRGALDVASAAAGWKPGEIRSKMFRHTYCSARLQTLDRGFPVSIYTVARELGHGGESLVKRVYGHLGEVRHRAEVVEYRPSVFNQIPDSQSRKQFEERYQAVRQLVLVA